MTQFELLTDALDLFANGRKNAAKAQWAKLTADFRLKVLELLAYILRNPAEPLNCEVVLFSQKYGRFVLSDKMICNLKHILELNRG